MRAGVARAKRVLAAPVLAAVAALALLGCGQETTTSPASRSWQEDVCALSASFELATKATVFPADEHPAPSSVDLARRQASEARKLAAGLRSIAIPEDLRPDAERFIEIITASFEWYEKAQPRLDALTQRWEQVLQTIDEDELPPFPEGETVAGGIMTQLMSVPAAKAVWDDLMRELEAGPRVSFDEAEIDRLTKRLGFDHCD